MNKFDECTGDRCEYYDACHYAATHCCMRDLKAYHEECADWGYDDWDDDEDEDEYYNL